MSTEIIMETENKFKASLEDDDKKGNEEEQDR
jgi:hypothetical protein